MHKGFMSDQQERKRNVSELAPVHKLTEKQKVFCREYLVDLNGAQAYIRAGYSENGASEGACRLLGNVRVQEFIKDGLKEREKRTKISADDLLQFWHDLTYTPMDEMFDQGPDGTLVPKSFDQMTVRAKRCVSEMKSQFASDGTGWQSIKRLDQIKASEMLGKSLGLFKDKLEVSGGEKPIKVLNIIGVVADDGELVPEAEYDSNFH
jgi:phage terminase small subunit|tara:strand:+ start:233 stop:853 length:621 start_codon:yes stop_codon:yes gene_type:complete